MFEYKPGRVIDNTRGIEINFSTRINPAMDNVKCSIGSYYNNKTKIGFFFDSIFFRVRLNNDDINDKSSVIFCYIFCDQINQNYKKNLQDLKDVCIENDRLLIEQFKEAFVEWITNGGQALSWLKIYKIKTLESNGLMKIGKFPLENPFNWINIHKIEKIFEADLNSILLGNC